MNIFSNLISIASKIGYKEIQLSEYIWWISKFLVYFPINNVRIVYHKLFKNSLNMIKRSLFKNKKFNPLIIFFRHEKLIWDDIIWKKIMMIPSPLCWVFTLMWPSIISFRVKWFSSVPLAFCPYIGKVVR